MFHKNIYAVVSALLLAATLTSCGSGALSVQADGIGAQTDGTGVQTAGAGNNGAQLLSISVTPTNPAVAKNTSLNFTATGIYSDNTTQDLTSSVVWSSSNPDIVAIDTEAAAPSSSEFSAPTKRGGHAFGKGSGSTTITATAGSASGSTTVTVTSATLMSLAITPANPSIAIGANQQFIAMGTFSDNTTQNVTATVAWSSSNTGAATIDASGLATSGAAGSTTITATSGGVSGTAALTVTAITVAGSVTLSWVAPTDNTDGSPLVVAGYKIYYGTSSGSYTTVLTVGPATTYVIYNLAPGTYYFTATAYDAAGNESDYANEVSKTL